MTTTLLDTEIYRAWRDRSEQRSSVIESTCCEATNKLRAGDTTAFAAFAKRVNWWERRFQTQTCHSADIKKKDYQKWERDYKKLPYEVQKEAEAKLPF